MDDFPSMQARCVDAIKRRALRLLHHTARGQRLILTMYLWAEEGTEGALLNEIIRQTDLPWVLGQVQRHTADEARHATLLRRRLAELGARSVGPARVDVVSRWKLQRLQALCQARAGRFSAGRIVPVFALAFRMEVMGVRVMARHVSVMEQLEVKPVETAAMLNVILADEQKHVIACEAALHRLVRDDEKMALEELCAEIDNVDRTLGITGAAVLWVTGAVLVVAESVRKMLPQAMLKLRSPR